MTNAIITAVKIGIEQAGGAPWQIQAGMVAGGVVAGFLGGVVGWFGKKFKDNRKNNSSSTMC